MESVNYPNLVQHKKIHQKLISEVKCILLNSKQGKQVKAISLVRFLNEWVCKHILEDDWDIGKFIHKLQYRNYTVVPESRHPENGQDELVAKMQSLIKQREHSVITESEYCVQCSVLLDHHFSFTVPDKITAISRALSCIGSLSKAKHITDVDKKYFNFVLFQKAISQNLWSCFDGNDSKIRFLNNLRKDEIITNESHEVLKRTVCS
jgi:hypothetical protein